MIQNHMLQLQGNFASRTIRSNPRRLLLPGKAKLLAWLALALVPVGFRPASAQQALATQALPAQTLPQGTLQAGNPLPAAAAATAPVDPGTALPDDPSEALVASSAASSDSATSLSADPSPQGQTQGQARAQRRAERSASIHMKYIPAGWATTHPLPAKDKVLLGLKDLYNPLNFAAMFLSAGYEQVLNGSPNYGVDRGAFGERLGAAAIRESTQGIFTDAVFAPLLREDPRYYIEGPQYSFVHRTLYSITRPLVTRTDSGHSSVNGALLLGYAASSALSYTYYPQINKNFRDTASTFGGAIGGAAVGFFVTEFASDVLQKLHPGRPH
jgi:hypothetical protein